MLGALVPPLPLVGDALGAAEFVVVLADRAVFGQVDRNDGEFGRRFAKRSGRDEHAHRQFAFDDVDFLSAAGR